MQFDHARREFRYPEDRRATGRLRRIDREIVNPIVQKKFCFPLASEPAALLFAETHDDNHRHVEDVPRPCRQQEYQDAQREDFVQTAFGDMSIS